MRESAESREFKLVRSAVYLCRLAGETPSASKVIAAIKAVSGKGLRKTDVCRLMKELFLLEGDTCGNRSGTARELSGNRAGTDIEHDGNRSGTIPELPRNITGAVQTRNSKLEIDIPLDANASTPPPGAKSAKAKPVRIDEDLPEVSFVAEDELRVSALLLAHAPSGRIQPKTLARLRNQFRLRLDSVGAGCWRHGVDTALAKPAGWPYAVSVMANNPAGQAAPRPSARGAPARVAGKYLQTDESILHALDNLGRNSSAVRTGDNLLDWEQKPVHTA